MTEMFSYNFIISSENPNDIEVLNRGLTYGDGFFETMNMVNSNIPLLPYHFNRLTEAHEAFGMKLSFTLDTLTVHLKELSQRAMLPDGKIRLICWRKIGGLYSPTSNECEVLIQISPKMSLSAVKQKAVVFQEIRNMASSISRFKTLSAAKYVQAGIFMQKHEADEVILLDQHGHVSETLFSNLFFVKNGRLYTPSLSCGCIAGTMRQLILERYDVEESEYTLNDLKAADACFSSNAMGITPIQTLEDITFDIEDARIKELNELTPD